MGSLKDLIDRMGEEEESKNIPLHPSSNEETPMAFHAVVIASDGRMLATIADPPEVRVYAWVLLNLRFGPSVSRLTDLSKVALDCRLSLEETRKAFSRLIRDGDLKVQKDHRGREIYWLAPISWK